MNHGALTLQQKRLSHWQSRNMLPRYASMAFNIDSRCSEVDVRRAVTESIAVFDSLRARFTAVPGLKIPAVAFYSQQDFSCLEWTNLAFDAASWQAQVPHWTVYANWRSGSASTHGNHWLSLHVHALAMDLRSAEILCQSIECSLKGESITVPELDYGLVSDWQASLFEDEDHDTQAERDNAQTFWQRRFEALRPVSLPLSRFLVDARADSAGQDACQFGLSSDLFEGLRTLADANQGVTVPRLLEAAWAVCLAKSEGVDTLGLSTYCSERSVEELQDCCGLLDVYLPKQVVIEATYDWCELARAIESSDRQAMQYSEYLPPGRDASSVTSDGHQADVVSRTAAFSFADWTQCSGSLVSVSEVEHAADLHSIHLSVQCGVIDQITCLLRGDKSLTSEDDLSQLASRWQSLLERWLADAQASVASVRRALPAGETALQSTPSLTPVSVFDTFAEHVQQRPAAAAFRFKEQSMTYSELNGSVLLLQRALAEQTETGQHVGVLLDRSVALLPCVLGIMGSGRVLVPLDPGWPMARIEAIINDSSCSLVITDEANHSATEQLSVPSLLASTALAAVEGVAGHTVVRSLESPASADPAYIMYTSGTTGTPRGVSVSHGALNNYTQAMAGVLEAQPGSNFGWISTYAADLGYTAVFPALHSGGCIHLIEAAGAVDVIALNDYCQRFPLDILKIVPSHCLALLQAAAEADSVPAFLPLQTLVLGGESPSATLLDTVFGAANTPSRVLNHYGPTEATIGVMWAELMPEQPAGLAHVLANNSIHILDEDMVPVERGVRGELAISGASLSSGYYGVPAAEVAAFVNLIDGNGIAQRVYRTGDYAVQAADGRVHILGRGDDQIKVRGFRVEPAEIERILTGMAEVAEAVVVTHPAHSDQLVAYLVPPRGAVISTAHLRSALSAMLPEYMVPQRLLTLEQLPLTANGKVDRNCLPDPDAAIEREYQAPASDAQRLMVAIWQRALEVPRVGTADNFFEVGGHSLLGIKLLSQVRTQFRAELGPGAIAEYATPAALVEHLQSLESQPGMIEKIAAARLRIAAMSEEERDALEQRAGRVDGDNRSAQKSDDKGLSPAA